MRSRDVIICLVCIILAAALLITGGRRLDYINSARYRMKLIIYEPLENAPPSLAFVTVAMGAFRGLLVDVLWMRAEKLKDEGQFFDAKQIAEWITILQPRFAPVWEFHAWNMAYNISVAMPSTAPAERWRWVKNGYELLRDKGIPLNSKSILLYRELARIFRHKIGGVTDEAHKYYKLQLAMAMEPLIGKADDETYRALAEAPTRWEEIIGDANVAQLVADLKSSDQTFARNDEFASNYLTLRQRPNSFNPQAFKTIDNYRGTAALNKLDFFARAFQLRKVWKLEPSLMQQLNKLYGPIDWKEPSIHLPLDWRHPNTHALYWSIKGLQMASKEEWSFDEANTDRGVSHSLQALFHNGRIFIYEAPPKRSSDSSVEKPTWLTKEIFLRPDLRMFVPYNQSVLVTLEKYKKINKNTYISMQKGHRNMLIDAAFAFYQAGHKDRAKEIYNQLRKLYPEDRFKVSLVVFARERLREELNMVGYDDAKELVQMILRESYFYYAMRQDNEAFEREKMAKDVCDIYQSLHPSDDSRIDLPDLRVLRYLALLDFLNDEQYPPELRRNLIGRIKIERPKLAEQLEQQEKKLFEKLKK
jgi:hypothetical protein